MYFRKKIYHICSIIIIIILLLYYIFTYFVDIIYNWTKNINKQNRSFSKKTILLPIELHVSPTKPHPSTPLTDKQAPRLHPTNRREKKKRKICCLAKCKGTRRFEEKRKTRVCFVPLFLLPPLRLTIVFLNWVSFTSPSQNQNRAMDLSLTMIMSLPC